MKTMFMSRPEAKKFRPAPNSVIVSITTPGDRRVWLHPTWARIHRTYFYDVDEFSRSPIYPAITTFEAKDIATFISIAVAQDMNLIACHCDAGQSRSAAVAMFVRDMYRAEMAQTNWTSYNRFVYKMVMRAHGVEPHDYLNGWPKGE